jgi:hypothetical protein
MRITIISMREKVENVENVEKLLLLDTRACG